MLTIGIAADVTRKKPYTALFMDEKFVRTVDPGVAIQRQGAVAGDVARIIRIAVPIRSMPIGTTVDTAGVVYYRVYTKSVNVVPATGTSSTGARIGLSITHALSASDLEGRFFKRYG
ncbi:hypothetical protein Pmar_PMAR010324, partial [Perkinsus marinus ATCC 50983]